MPFADMHFLRIVLVLEALFKFTICVGEECVIPVIVILVSVAQFNSALEYYISTDSIQLLLCASLIANNCRIYPSPPGGCNYRILSG